MVMTFPPGDWSNRDNIEFYEIAQEELRTVSKLSGLENCPELPLVQQYFWGATQLLEVGAGYGRVLNYLIQHQFPGKIDAVERSQDCYHFLQKQFADQVMLYCQDIMSFQPQKRYDVALWLWSGISDFSKNEQPKAIQQVVNLLNDNGFLIMDTIYHDQPIGNPGGSSYQQEHHVMYKGIKLFGYCPSPQEIINMADSAGASIVRFLPYESKNGAPRLLFILQHKSSKITLD
jgi:SAM-dependent methyltransferase